MGDWGVYNTLGLGADLITTCWPGGAAFGSVNVKGAYSVFTASSPYDIGGIEVTLLNAGYYLDHLVDIAIGAAGSETIIANNLFWSMTTSQYWVCNNIYYLPVTIPAGTRISVRQQGSYNNASNSISMGMCIHPANSFHIPTLSLCTTFGANTADSGGTAMDPGTSVNTYGSWLQLSASTPHTIRGFQYSVGSGGDTSKSNCAWAVDVGVGSSGNEVALLSNVHHTLWTTTHQIHPNTSPWYPIEIPAGSRLVMRCKCDIATATDRLLDVVLYGWS
jgi:hypothetical protein